MFQNPIIPPKLFELPQLDPKIRRNYYLADWYHERIEKQVDEFSQELSKDEDMEVKVILNNGETIYVDWFGYYNPNMIIVLGLDESGSNTQVLLPHTDIQVVLTKVKKINTQDRKKIGFQPRDENN